MKDICRLYIPSRSTLCIVEINALLKKCQIPGAAVSIIDHKKSFVRVFGVANTINNTPITKETIFEIGSISKVFTALLAADIFANPGQLQDPFVKYSVKLSNDKIMRNITIEELLTHTSGFPKNLPENIRTIEQAQDYLLGKALLFKEGTNWRYSDTGTGLLEVVLQNYTNKPINQLYIEHILDPLGMAPTGIEMDYQRLQGVAQGYMENGNVAPYFTGPFPSSGGIRASAEDMLFFLMASLCFQNVPKNLRQAMKNTQTARVDVNTEDMQQGLGWNLFPLECGNGLLVTKENGKDDCQIKSAKWLPKQEFKTNKLIEKVGMTMGFTAYIGIIPQRQTGIVILLNKRILGGYIESIGRKILLKGDSTI
jgi:beta-lactamase class C